MWLVFVLVQNFFGKFHVCLGATALNIVEYGWLSVRRSFTQLDIAGNHGLEHRVAQVFANLVCHLPTQAQAGIVHG